jgi:hypothetical protein
MTSLSTTPRRLAGMLGIAYVLLFFAGNFPTGVGDASLASTRQPRSSRGPRSTRARCASPAQLDHLLAHRTHRHAAARLNTADFSATGCGC